MLGLVDARIWTRSADVVASRKARPVEAKESLRWITGARSAAARLGAAAESLIVVSDQESDLCSHFARRSAGTDLLVRACHDRALVEGGPMRDAAARWPLQAEDTVTIPATPGQPARTTQVTLRAGLVALKRPAREPSQAADHEPPTLALHLVVVEEPEPPQGQAPLCWRLLTPRPVTWAAQAREMVRLYRLRWRIEEVFRALKRDGLGLDATQVRVPDKLFRLAALALGAAVRLLQLVDARAGGGRPMSDVRPACRGWRPWDGAAKAAPSACATRIPLHPGLALLDRGPPRRLELLRQATGTQDHGPRMAVLRRHARRSHPGRTRITSVQAVAARGRRVAHIHPDV